MYVKVLEEDVVTTGSPCEGTEYVGPVQGRLLGIIYTEDDYPSAASSPAGTVTITIATEDTEQTLYTSAIVAESFSLCPRQYVVDNTGAALYQTQSTGSPATYYYIPEYYYIADERISITVSGGTEGSTGNFKILVG